MNVVFSRRAERGLEAIADWIAADDPRRALTFIAELRAAAQGLAEFPDAFPLAHRLRHLGIRKRTHGRYLILYRRADRQIEIIDIVHGARDYSSADYGSR